MSQLATLADDAAAAIEVIRQLYRVIEAQHRALKLVEETLEDMPTAPIQERMIELTLEYLHDTNREFAAFMSEFRPLIQGLTQ